MIQLAQFQNTDVFFSINSLTEASVLPNSSRAPEGSGETRELDSLLFNQRVEHHGQFPVARFQGGSPPADHGLPGHLGRDHHREPAEQPAQQHHLPVPDSASSMSHFTETSLIFFCSSALPRAERLQLERCGPRAPLCRGSHSSASSVFSISFQSICQR